MNLKSVIDSLMAKVADRSGPAHDLAKTGSRIEDLELNAIHVLAIPVTASANSTPVTVAAPCKMQIVDVFVRATATSGSGTLKLRDSGGADISNAIICAVDTTLTRVSTLIAAKLSVNADVNLQVIANGANDRGILYVLYQRVA